MTILFECSIQSKFLEPDEINRITGCRNLRAQVKWLTENGWTFSKSKANDPIIGHVHARFRMAGIDSSTRASAGPGPAPDFSKVR
jgi:hypothetical protein